MSSNLDSTQKQQVRSFGKVIGMSAGLSLFVMVLGSLVRATESGLSCPDWPLCYDQAIPVFDFHIFLEWFHRLVAGSLSIFFLVALWRVVKYPLIRKLFGLQLATGLALFAVQVVLGGLTVLELLKPSIVSFHLINAVAFLSVLLWISLRARNLISEYNERLVVIPRRLVVTLLLIGATVFLQILLGGAVSTNHAGMACPDFPTCFGQWFPSYSFLVWLQMSHRYLAFLILAAVVFLSANAGHLQGLPLWSRLSIKFLPFLVVVQVLLGVLNVYFNLPEWASVAHLANALAIYSLSFCGFIEAKSFMKRRIIEEGQRNIVPVANL